jgi:DNA polymerase-1
MAARRSSGEGGPGSARPDRAAAGLAEALADRSAKKYETVPEPDGLDAWIAPPQPPAASPSPCRRPRRPDARRDHRHRASPRGPAGPPTSHRHRNGATDLLGPGLLEGQVPEAEALARLKRLFEDASVLKIGHDLKPLTLLLGRHGIGLAPYDDTILSPTRSTPGAIWRLASLADRWFSHAPRQEGRNGSAAAR